MRLIFAPSTLSLRLIHTRLRLIFQSSPESGKISITIRKNGKTQISTPPRPPCSFPFFLSSHETLSRVLANGEEKATGKPRGDDSIWQTLLQPGWRPVSTPPGRGNRRRERGRLNAYSATTNSVA